MTKRIKDIELIYRKVKSDIYYSNNVLYKKMIVEFEANSDSVSESFSVVKKIYNGKTHLLDGYINQIKIVAYPKNVDCVIEEKDKIYGFNVEDSVQSVNFFISCPIELLLLDALWTYDIGKIVYDKNLIDKQCIFGNIMYDHRLYDLNQKNNSFFEPYFYKYRTWRDQAFKTIKKLSKESDVLMINYDIKQFYYNYLVDFDELKSFLKCEDYEIQFKIIERIYEKYNEILCMYKKIQNIPNRYPLPIGLFSSRIISNLALCYYDDHMKRMFCNGYYGRYVDDMILVIPLTLKNGKSKQEILNELCSTISFLNFKNGVYSIPSEFLRLCHSYNENLNLLEDVYSSHKLDLRINNDKIDIFYFKKNSPNLLSQIYDVKMLIKASDLGYSIDKEYNANKLIDDIFRGNKSNNINKISDLKLTSIDKYQLSLTLTKLINFYKDVEFDSKDKNIQNISKRIIEFMSNAAGLKYYQQWEKVFYLLNILEQKYSKQYFQKMKKYIRSEISFALNADEYINIQKVKKLVKSSVENALFICKDMGASIKYSKCSRKDKEASKKWLDSFMINKNLYSLPLLQFDKNNTNVINFDSMINGTLNLKAFKYIPYFINLEELCIYKFLVSMFRKEKTSFDVIFDEYCKLNNIDKDCLEPPNKMRNYISYGKITSHKFETRKSNKIVVSLINEPPFSGQGVDESDDDYNERKKAFVNEQSMYEDYYVGVVNIPLDPDILIDKASKIKMYNSISYKQKISHILNEAIDNKVNHLIFPELSIPIQWLKTLIFYSKRHSIQITFGMQYIFNMENEKKHIYNLIGSFYPFVVSGVHKYVYPDIREKRYYPCFEKLYFDQNNFIYNEEAFQDRKIVSFRGGVFTNFLCYELTSLSDRFELLDTVTTIFVPVLNKDTNYFSSIVDTTARELYCYVCMSNTSLYGDSRITGPFKTEEKDIVKLKGGENIYLVVGKINIRELIEKRKNINQEHYEREANKKNNAKKDKQYKPLCASSEEELNETNYESHSDFLGDTL